MTLSRYLRDFIYIPLGGSREGQARTVRNLMITMLLGGLWHGAAWGFVLWGALHGAALSLEHFRRGRARLLPPVFAWTATFLFVSLAWIPFRAPTLDMAWAFARRLVTPGPATLMTPGIAIAVVGVLALQLAPGAASRRDARATGRAPGGGTRDGAGDHDRARRRGGARQLRAPVHLLPVLSRAPLRAPLRRRRPDSRPADGPAFPRPRRDRRGDVCVVLLLLFEGASIRRSGEEMDSGWERTLVLFAGRPAGALSDATGLGDVKDRLVAWAHPDDGLSGPGGFEQAADTQLGGATRRAGDLGRLRSAATRSVGRRRHAP